jgi:hypothetical protein
MACIKAHRTYLASSSSVTVWPLLRMQPTSSCSTPRKRDTTLCTPAQQQVQCSKKKRTVAPRSRCPLVGVVAKRQSRRASRLETRPSGIAPSAASRDFFPPWFRPRSRQRSATPPWRGLGRWPTPSVALAVASSGAVVAGSWLLLIGFVPPLLLRKFHIRPLTRTRTTTG